MKKPVWQRLCLSKTDICLNDDEQISHLYGFSPLIVSLCMDKKYLWIAKCWFCLVSQKGGRGGAIPKLSNVAKKHL